MKKLAFATLLFLSAAAAFAALMPLKPWLENRLEEALEARGLQQVEITIAHVGLNGATLNDVAIGQENPLVLKDITVNYAPSDIWQRNLDELSIKGASFEIREAGGKWVFSGLGGRDAGAESRRSPLMSVPVTAEQVAGIPFRRFRLEDSTLTILGGFGQLLLPLELDWRKSLIPEAKYAAGGLEFTRNGLQILTGEATASAALREGQWQGNWRLEGIKVQGAPVPVPDLQGSGTLAVNASRVEVTGNLGSADGLWHAEFGLVYTPEEPGASVLTLTKTTLPWKEGRLAVQDVKIPLMGKEPIKVSLQVQHVSIGELMQSMTGDRVSATGLVSGVVPVSIGRDGSIKVLEGSLKAEEPGTIAMPPDAIPGDNEQIALVREILENLQYTTLSIETSTDSAGQLAVLMKVEGKNPKVYDGRPVKLNVNLTGDVLEFVQKNILFLTSPETLLNAGQSENEEN